MRQDIAVDMAIRSIRPILIREVNLGLSPHHFAMRKEEEESFLGENQKAEYIERFIEHASYCCNFEFVFQFTRCLSLVVLRKIV